jgi:type II secretory pathway pseudopilin PulG
MNGSPAQRGFTYLGILFVVAFIGAGLGVVGQLWSVSARRADEEQLLFVGDSFRRAIGSYYRVGGGRQYPQSLEQLLLDERVTPPARHLRKLYADPITGTTDWQLVTLADGAIIGVASSSIGRPLKVANFAPQDIKFEGAECYCDWQFVFSPSLRRAVRPTRGSLRLRPP